MRLVDLEEWSVLQAVQHYLARAVESAIDDNELSQDECDTSNYVLDNFEFLRYELQKLVISIPTHRELEDQTIVQFKAKACEVFSCLEKVLMVCSLPDESAKQRKFSKLWELEKRYRGGIEEHCFDSFVDLALDDHKAWSSVLPTLTAFNKGMESLFWTRIRESPPPAENLLPSSPKLDLNHKIRVEAILKSLHERLLKCKKKSSPCHLMLLEVAGQKWKIAESLPDPMSLFLSSCRNPPGWQEVECLQSEHSSEQPNSKLQLLSSLCQSILECQCYDDTLQLLVNEKGLYRDYSKKGRTQRRAAVPIKTIKNLLDSDCLSPLRSGSASAATFTIQEKRELALNLAWCFMHLFDFTWTDGGWSAEKIFLLSSSNQPSASVFLDDPPYILCGLPNAATQQLPEITGDLFAESVFLSFGKLLVEIETGKNVVVTEKNKLGDPSLWLTIDKIISEDGMVSACDDYINAIEGCLQLHRSFGHLTKDELIRDSCKLIYDAIIANLERDFGHYRRPSLKRHRSEQSPKTRNSGPAVPMDYLNQTSSEAIQNKSVRSLDEPTQYLGNACVEHPAKRRRGFTSSRMKDDQASENHPKLKKTPQLTGCGGSNGDKTVYWHEASSLTRPFRRPSSRDDFEVAIICALPHEYAAVEDVVDEFWDEEGDSYGKVRGDPNDYATGRIDKHNVVLVLLPHMGKTHASSAANSIRLSYVGVKLALLVGVCGAVPKYGNKEILLGDVIISGTVVQYDFGRGYGDKFRRKDTMKDNLGRASKEIRGLTAKYQTPRTKGRLEKRIAEILGQMQAKVAQTSRHGEYDCPGSAADKLYKPEYRHRHIMSPKCICASCACDLDPVCDAALIATCADLQCDEGELVIRKRQSSGNDLMVHVGAVASGDTVIKSGTNRDNLAKELDVIAFEMEGSGVRDELPCLVVKSVSDYADSHKQKNWQIFAAATAASASRAILERYIQTDTVPRASTLEVPWKTEGDREDQTQDR